MRSLLKPGVSVVDACGGAKCSGYKQARVLEISPAITGSPRGPGLQLKSSHFIAQITLDHRGFEFFSVSASGRELHCYVSIRDLAREQETCILEFCGSYLPV
jgi:hypothetical protein